MMWLAFFVTWNLHSVCAQDGPEILLAGEPVPTDEGAAMNRITDWLDKLHWTGSWETGEGQVLARAELERLAGRATEAPWLALGLAQAFLLYFWWRDDGMEIDITAAKLSTFLHHISIRATGCDDPTLPNELFRNLQCAWRWRHVLMIPTELGVHLARERSDMAQAAGLFREAKEVFSVMRRLPHFSRKDWPSPYSINTNAEFFTGPVNRPVWPTKGFPFAEFLEANVGVFQAELEALLSSGQFDHLYWTGEVSLTQFSARHDGWAMLSLFKNQKLVSRVCDHTPKSCALLAARPEIAECTAGDAGAAFARLLPGQGLRPHFWNAPRLGAHVGLRTPPGATMWVGGEAVTWEEGKAVIFDDTYTHSVLHEGTEARYLLIGWLCHPCDLERATPTAMHREPLCESSL